MKINIFYHFKDTPYGGGNQFLKALRNSWIKKNVYEVEPEKADIILVNSYPFEFESKKKFYKSIFTYKNIHNKILIHRIDGPISRVRGSDLHLDKAIFLFNQYAADGTVFQSDWSKKENYGLGYTKSAFETVIQNAPDPEIFYPHQRTESDKKIRIIATSWSGNMNKGFDIYKFLDEHLDFNRYQMTFAGNSPKEFQNIRHVKPLPSNELANLLRQHDIYITASKNEPCSNSLIEALHCGLPAVYKNGSSHGNIVGSAGEGFNEKVDVIEAIEKVAEDIDSYRSQIHMKTISEVSDELYRFCLKVYELSQEGAYTPKKFSRLAFYRIILYTTLRTKYMRRFQKWR